MPSPLRVLRSFCLILPDSPAPAPLIHTSLVATAENHYARRPTLVTLLAWSTPPLAIVGLYAAGSIVTFAVYGLDKRAAIAGRRRVRERTLHLLEILFGWPGALVAQQAFKHKRQKAKFYLVTWLIAAMHVGAWVWWAGR